MRLRILPFALLLLALVALPVLAGCGTEEETEVNEGEPLELADISFDVQITRFLNPNSTEDATYLEGAPPLGPGQQYLAVFMQITNDGNDAAVVPYPFTIVDTRGDIYQQARVENDFALIPGTLIPPEETIPGEETAARNGPIEGSMILFPILESATENRPLQLEVLGPDGTGEVELDI